MIKIGIDPSGTGTTAIVCYINNKLVDKTEIISKEWTIHVLKILEYIKEQQECNIYIEDCLPTNANGSKDRDSLLKLIGAIKFNTYNYLLDENFNKKTKWIAPIFTKSVVKNMENLSKYNNGCIQKFSKDENLTYEYGKGWFYNNEKISNHLRDAIIIANYKG
ncbi:hypothetical protein [Spiroplasma endosymbiont of Megaselia nigra]|uniref:hypothetical protein n=1 Tax=Spiroplasma endosymbiont of Megaselia nigra TaxID=2478537 RepID=UPI000F88608A|nr:hypothetical protein [Spiroplasma endosymbiont of Megaselia nigra]RUO86315.1 hypothetical protein D9R21_03820 [Spiroplasma endosymbiont of Megaselia nigra]